MTIFLTPAHWELRFQFIFSNAASHLPPTPTPPHFTASSYSFCLPPCHGCLARFYHASEPLLLPSLEGREMPRALQKSIVLLALWGRGRNPQANLHMLLFHSTPCELTLSGKSLLNSLLVAAREEAAGPESKVPAQSGCVSILGHKPADSHPKSAMSLPIQMPTGTLFPARGGLLATAIMTCKF